jgi:Fe-S cluster biogenesis protein NfuA
MSAATVSPLSIEAQPIDSERCLLVVSRPLVERRWVYFASKPSAVESTLVARLFEAGPVAGVLLAHDRVILTRHRPAARTGLGRVLGGLRRLIGDPDASADSWRSLASASAGIIRQVIESGEPIVADDVFERMPSSAELRHRVQRVLDETVNPVVAGHGGGVSIFDVIDNVVYVRMSGGCQGCGLSENTLKHGVEAAVREAVPEILSIIDLTDHKAGMNPWRR